MTENKRFEICGEGSTNLDVTTYIVEYGDGYDDCFELYESKEDSQKVCDKLNSILDENEQLKIKLEDIALDMENAKESNDDAQYELYKIKKENEKLKKENEELKEELTKFKEWEKHIGDVKREELDRVFKMSIYEIAEAFDYYKERIKKLEKELQE